MYTIVGFKHNEGFLDEEKTRPWENYSLYCTKDDETVDGKAVEVVKVRPAVLRAAFPTSKDVIGSNVDFSMELRRFGNKVDVRVTSIIKR